MQTIGVGLIGTGFMGKCHALAYRNVAQVFDLPLLPKLMHVVDADKTVAARFASQYECPKYGDDWRALLDDPRVDLISITTPNYLHEEMALSAMAARKHVLCEKPLAMTAEGAYLLKVMAEKAGVKTMVGYNYLKSPAIQFAKQWIEAGHLGQLYAVNGRYHEDYMANPAIPYSWRCQRALAGAGALGDLGCHLISLLRTLIGSTHSVTAQMQTIIPTRDAKPVENEDQLQALLQFENGTSGVMSVSRVAWGRKMGLALELTGEKGALSFDQENMNEISVYQLPRHDREAGFKKLLMGPAHPDYAAFCPAPGHGLGFNDLKLIEIKDLLLAIAHDKPAYPDFAEGYEVELISNAIIVSAKLGQTVSVKTLGAKHRLINHFDVGLGREGRLMDG